MLSIVLSIGENILILFVMIAIGVVFARKNILTREGPSQLTEIVLLIATPCIIINAFLKDLSGVSWQNLLFVAAFAAVIHFLGILLAPLFFRKEPDARRKVLRFAMIYANVGFMGLPLLEGFLGSDGVLYASLFIALFNIFCWTHGVKLMNSRESGGVPLRKCLLNPGTIGLGIGLLILVLHIPVPDPVSSLLDSLAGLNTPLAMLCIGVHISAVAPRQILRDKPMLAAAALRLLGIPAIVFLLLTIFTREYALFAAILLQSAMPAAANAALFADRYQGDRPLASQAVALSTLCSLVTLPLMAVLAGLVCR